MSNALRCNLIQIATQLDAKHRVTWRRLHGNLRQITRWFDAKHKATWGIIHNNMIINDLQAVIKQSACWGKNTQIWLVWDLQLNLQRGLTVYEWKYEKATSGFVKSQTWLIFSNSVFYKKGLLRVGFAETTWKISYKDRQNQLHGEPHP